MPLQTVLYDGSLAGLLSVVFDVFAHGLQVDRLVREVRHQPAMFGGEVRVATDLEKARRVWTKVKQTKGFQAGLVLRCWLWDTTESDTDIVHILTSLFRDGVAAARDFRQAAVMRCETIRKKMNREIHRMHAFVRFQEAADGLFFAVIEPDFDVLPLAIDHFEDRYQDMEWLIWDEQRQYGFWRKPQKEADSPHSYITLRIHATKAGEKGSSLSAKPSTIAQQKAVVEDGFQQLWTAYFDAVDILERRNPKLHRQHVPKRYWKYLTEKQP